MKILILGGLGYLGARVAQYLLNAQYEVVITTRELKSIPSELSGATIYPIVWDKYESLVSLCKGVDVVIHAAGLNALDSANSPTTAIKVNGELTSSLVEAAIEAKVSKFIYISTAHVYSDKLVGYFNEDSRITNLHPYATSHVIGENALLYRSRQKKIQGIVLRLSNAFGAPIDKNANCWMLFINNISRMLIEENKIIVKSNKQDQRDFISISEVSRVLEKFLSVKLSPQWGEIYNLGAGRSHSLTAIAELVTNRYQLITKNSADIIYENSSEIIKANFLYDNSKLIKLNICIKDNFQDEIDSLINKCVNWFK